MQDPTFTAVPEDYILSKVSTASQSLAFSNYLGVAWRNADVNELLQCNSEVKRTGMVSDSFLWTLSPNLPKIIPPVRANSLSCIKNQSNTEKSPSSCGVVA